MHETLDALLGELVEKIGITRDQVAECCIVGNTAMAHLLLQLPTPQMVMAPYVAATDAALDIKARDIGLAIAPGAAESHFGKELLSGCDQRCLSYIRAARKGFFD